MEFNVTVEHNVISYSDGKDSTAMLLLAIEQQAEHLQAVFADTGNEHPSTYEYVRYVEQSTGCRSAGFAPTSQNRSKVSKTKVATFFPASDLGATSAADAETLSHGIHARVEWAKTSRGGRQYNLIRVDQEVELCSSIYGLCE